MQTPNYMTVVSEANASTHNASTSFGKTFFAWCFTLNGKNALWLTISYQKPFVVSVPALCFQILIWPKMGLTYAISIVKWIFGFFFFFIIIIIIYFLLFFTDFKSLMFHNNIVKISEILNKWKMLKSCIQTTYPINFCIFCSHFYYGKKRENIQFFF